ncbi:response regulator transcription factor [Luteibacter aegosomatissinici]|uniref:response regulator transcription factor n=1 Tax=Luteibacter aegosomatissinici TaxID=2911539 RepID=UPI001FFA7736|nr:response regulator transcription factor [Luteibacter aegosomatissinici]UPG96108.1 response regulator transcription factor [Luteibacter aegosomatissinici]
MPLKVILADDHPLVLVGGALALENAHIDVVGKAKAAGELLDMLADRPCDVVITDFLMPSDQQDDGFALLDTIAEKYPNLGVIVLTMVNRPAALQSMLSRGARGIVDKRAPMDELATAAKAVHDGETYLSESLLDILNEADDNSVAMPGAPLSPREKEVIKAFVNGQSLQQIADREGKSVKTISRQKRDAMRKLGVDHDSLLGDYVRDHGLL